MRIMGGEMVVNGCVRLHMLHIDVERFEEDI